MKRFLILLFSLTIASCSQQSENDDSLLTALNDDILVEYEIVKSSDDKYTIKGVIKDVESSAPTMDIFNIILVNSRTGTVNKTDGSFQLNVPDQKGKIKMYYVGRETLTFDYQY